MTPRQRGELLLDYGGFLISRQHRSRAEQVLLQARDELAANCMKPLEREAIGLLDSPKVNFR